MFAWITSAIENSPASTVSVGGSMRNVHTQTACLPSKFYYHWRSLGRISLLLSFLCPDAALIE